MAHFTIRNKNRCVVKFSEPSLRAYQITATPYRYGRKIFVNFGLPTINFRHHDTRTLLDIADGLKLVVKYAGELSDKPTRLRGRAEELMIAKPTQILMPIFPNRESPFIEGRVEQDGFVRWTVLGFWFNDDWPSAAKYTACLEAIPLFARALNVDQT